VYSIAKPETLSEHFSNTGNVTELWQDPTSAKILRWTSLDLFLRVTSLKKCFGLAWINAKCPPKPLYHSPSSAGQGKGNMIKGSWVETRTGRVHLSITITAKTD